MTALVVRRLLPIAVSLAFLAVSFVAVGPERVFRKAAGLDFGWMALALFIGVPQVFLSAVRWKGTSERLGVLLPLDRAWQEYYRSYFLNQVLPFGILGDVWRAGRQARMPRDERRVGLGLALSSVALERASGQVVLLIWLCLTMPFWWSFSSARGARPMDTSALLLAALVVVLTCAVVFRRAARLEKVRRLLEYARAALWDQGAAGFQLLVSSAILGTLVLQYFAVLRALGFAPSALEVVVLALPTLGAAALPFTSSGWGAREMAGGVLFSAAGWAASDGVTVGVVFGLLQLCCSLPGLVITMIQSRSSQQLVGSEMAVEEFGARFSIAHAVLVLFCSGVSWMIREAWPVAAAGAISLSLYIAFGRLEAHKSRFSAANIVTLLRLGLLVALATLRLGGPTGAFLVAVILGLDGLDGWLARKYSAATKLGARFDMETDALLVLVCGFMIFLSGHLAPWVLMLGLMRYGYVLLMATGAFQEAPPSPIGRAVFTVVTLSLVASLWPLEPVHRPLALVATLLLAYSFARSVRWSVSQRAEAN